MNARLIAPLIAAAVLTGCGSTATTTAPATVSKIDLIQLWETAIPCPDNPRAKLLAGPGRGRVEQQFVVTDADIRADLEKITAPPESEAEAKENVSKLRQGLVWLWWQLEVSQGRYADDTSTDDMVTAMAMDHNEFQRGRMEIEAAIGQGRATPRGVNSTFTAVCDHGAQG